MDVNLADLRRWMMEIPASFLAEPDWYPKGAVSVRAVMNDLYESMFGTTAPETLLALCDPRDSTPGERNRVRLAMVSCHLLWHPSFRTAGLSPAGLEALVRDDLQGLTMLVSADDIVRDEERCEELIRRALRAFAMRPAGETEKQAEDRLRQVDSMERARVLEGALRREKRAREVREAMARKAAEEAAARVCRE